MSEIKGHIYRILWDKIIQNNKNDRVAVGFILKDIDENEIKISGFINIDPYPCINDYVVAMKTKERFNDAIKCSYIEIKLPIKVEYIEKKIKELLKNERTNKLTATDIKYLIENNPKIWDSIRENKLIIGKIKKEKIDNLYNNFGYKFKDDKQKFKDFLDGNMISLKQNQIDNLFEKYQESKNIISTIVNNLIDLSNVSGITITTLINIADRLNYQPREKVRLIIIYKLKYSPNGDTCMTREKLVKELLKDQYLLADINYSIDDLLARKYIKIYNNFVYETKILSYEKNIGKYLNYNNDKAILEKYMESARTFLDDYDGNKLNDEQDDSFMSIFKSNINITVGPAGTGKSEILVRLSKFIEDKPEISILFLTPTGKACDRLTKGFEKNDIGDKAYTIHKFNRYIANGSNEYDMTEINEFENIIKTCYKIFVIDEMSMVGLEVFNDFIEKIQNFDNCILFVLGDTNQLPSISCGDVLNHMVISKEFNVVELKHIYRSSSPNLLIAQENVLKFRPLTDGFIENDQSFVWFKEDPISNKEYVLNYLRNHINDFNELPLFITSTNAVITNYQDEIKNIFNIGYDENHFIEINKIRFNIGDYLMIKENNYQEELMNGMIGKIISFAEHKRIVEIEGEKKTIIEKKVKILFNDEKEPRIISVEDLGKVIMSYLITIHKSQGSESDFVIIILSDCPMNTINLLYTAITRTKKKCILISKDETIGNIILKKRLTKRISNLQDFCK